MADGHLTSAANPATQYALMLWDIGTFERGAGFTKFDKNQHDMGTIELRSNLDKMVDQIDNEQLLHAIYDFLKDRMSSEEGQIWKSLTDDQKKEVYFIVPGVRGRQPD